MSGVGDNFHKIIEEQDDADSIVSCVSVIQEKGEYDFEEALRFPVGTVCYPVPDQNFQTSWTTTTYSRSNLKCGLKLYQCCLGVY